MWKVSTKNTTLTIHSIYHLPYLLTNKITNTMFLDDFTEYITKTIPDNNQTNNLFVGDFNLHVSEGNTDIDSAIFLDILEAMGLYQHVSFSTHNQGNTLDLVISELGSNECSEYFNQQNVKLNANLDEMVQSLEDEFRRVMDDLASELKCTASLKPKRPWYDAEACEQKQIVRKLERKLIKYKLDSLWTAFKKARNKYNTLLNHKKGESIR